ncbi:hypothetical protein PYJP_14840 [Pyrofollis japonicus]|nr:hypothetical protein PYJP_14840 [Pyrofollis japonicus]
MVVGLIHLLIFSSFVIAESNQSRNNCEFYVIDAWKLGFGERIFVETLQGIVNRDKPVLYVSHTPLDKMIALQVFQDTFGCKPIPVEPNPALLLRMFSDEIRGLIIYDENIPGEAYLAASLGGVLDSLPVSQYMLEELQHTRYPIVLDLRGVFNDTISVHTYLLKNIKMFNTSSIVVLPSGATALIDFAVKYRYPIVSLSPIPQKAKERELLDEFLSKIHGLYVYGFFPDGGAGEYYGVRLVSRHGFSLIVASDAPSLSFSEWFRDHIGKLPRKAAPKGRPINIDNNGIYVALVVSDGDNIAYLMNTLPSKERWGNNLRGTIPVTWTINPLTARLAPHLLLYYLQTASPNDTLVPGVSGDGYYYGCDMSLRSLKLHAAAAKELSKKIEAEYAVFITPVTRQVLNLHAFYRGIISPVHQANGLWGYVQSERLPLLIYAVPVTYHDYRDVLGKILSIKQRPLALVIYLDAWSFNMNRIYELTKYLESNGARIVNLTDLVETIRTAPQRFKTPWCSIKPEPQVFLELSKDYHQVRVYSWISGELLAVSRADPAILVINNSAQTLKPLVLRNSSTNITLVFKTPSAKIIRMYLVNDQGVLVKTLIITQHPISVKVVDALLDQLDTMAWSPHGPPGGGCEAKGPRYFSIIGSQQVMQRPLGPDPYILCENCKGVIVFDDGFPHPKALALLVKKAPYDYLLIDAFSKGDTDNDNVSELHTVSISINLELEPDNYAEYDAQIIPLGHGWNAELPILSPLLFHNCILEPLLEDIIFKTGFSKAIQSSCQIPLCTQKALTVTTTITTKRIQYYTKTLTTISKTTRTITVKTTNIFTITNTVTINKTIVSNTTITEPGTTITVFVPSSSPALPLLLLLIVLAIVLVFLQIRCTKHK